MPRSLSELTDEDVQEIQNLAALFFSPKEIAVIREFDPVTFKEACEDLQSPIYAAFQGGRLQGEIDLRTGIMKMAKAGSSPAQTMALDLLKQSKIKLMER